MCIKTCRTQRQYFRKEEELTKEEYLLLVETAERTGRIRLKLLMQTLACTGIRVQELTSVTVEHVREGKLEISSFERGNSALLHSKAGSVLARTKYGVTDKEVLDAIRYHTTGRPGMTLLDKIVFVADYMEPGREEAPDLAEVRPLAFQDLDQALLRILSDTLVYLNGTGKKIDPMTQRTWEFYEKMVRHD